MKTGTWVMKSACLLAFLILILIALPGAGLAQPSIAALSFTPATINTSAGPATVTVNFSLTDPSAGVSYFETAFVDPSGSSFLRASKSISPPSAPVTSSVAINFPQFSHPGTWTLAYVFISDASGATLFLDSNGLAAAGFVTALPVTLTADTTPPNITAFSFTPTSVNTTSASAAVTVNFTLTDDLTGANFFQVVFTSPSGNSIQSASKSFTPGTNVTNSVAVTFPKFSESGTWTVSSVFIADASGNTLFLDTPGLVARGFAPTTLTVTTIPDTTPPTLTSFSFTPASLFTGGGTVLVSPVVADDTSGVSRVEVTFVSPSGNQTVTGAANISPPSTSPSPSATQIQLSFPNLSEVGTWTQASVFISDAAGNTTLINQPITLTINPPGADTTPPLIIPTVSPMPNSSGWNNSTPVTVTWNVSDPESGVATTSNCGSTPINSPTLGTTVTCSATNGAGLSSSASVLVKIDISAPVTSNVLATPDPVIINTDVTITATVTDTGGSHVASAEFQVDGGPFDNFAGAFGSDTVNVSLTLPGSATPLLQTPGVHNICVRGTDFADNAGATTCVLFAVYDPKGGFVTGGGGANSPADTVLGNPAGPVTFAFNPKYLPNNQTVPSGDLEFHYNAGNIVFKSTGWDFLVLTNGNRGQAQGTGTINGSTVCKFSLDAWNASFPPGNVDAFGLTIFNCAGGSGNRYVLPTAPITKGSIKVHQ